MQVTPADCNIFGKAVEGSLCNKTFLPHPFWNTQLVNAVSSALGPLHIKILAWLFTDLWIKSKIAYQYLMFRGPSPGHQRNALVPPCSSISSFPSSVACLGPLVCCLHSHIPKAWAKPSVFCPPGQKGWFPPRTHFYLPHRPLYSHFS